MRASFPILIPALVALAGCAQFPELDATVTEEARAAPAPELVDNSVVLGPASEAILDEETQADMEARAAALEARAEAASGPVISPEEKAELLRRAAALRAEAARVAQES
ncbi:hypothetical protein R3X27_23700 [Tropicimonas sp. TH_r6]|uniref:hypothetical protein n=1 Tax=Tropicimonas sp. TH_r6 TaxID=3082085 RepID=UPI0029558826|nr:hypothetical protein [Tropicimonas sp. TH_r6]MDV7145699.1 hypothetical protein [Tropicimonas sp. TH_r6]